MKNKRVAASIYVFNFLEIGKKIEQLIKVGVNWIHIDIMDGQFVNNYALCQKFCQNIKQKYNQITLDAHMMCIDSYRYIKSFAQAGCDYFNFHYESLRNKDKSNILWIIEEIRKNGMKPILAINPETSVEHIIPYLKYLDGIMCMNINPGFNGQKIIESSYSKIKQLSNYKKENNLNYFIMTDGGAREETYKKICNSGAEVIVVGAFINVDENKIKEQVEKIQSLKND